MQIQIAAAWTAMLEIIHDAIRSRDHATMATRGIIFSLTLDGPWTEHNINQPKEKKL